MLPRLTLLTFTTTITSTAHLLVHAVSPCGNATPLLIQANHYRFINTCPTTVEMAEQPTTEWLQDRLSELLASPHIHFTQPNLPGLHLRMGPGPIDLFSTRYMNMFTQEATGTVNGQAVDKDELKENLLKLQKKYNKDSLKCVPQSSEGTGQLATKMAWTVKDTGSEAEIMASATTKLEGGTNRIDTLKIDCAQSLLA
ncbi:hypothetical protein BDY19DRAFT_916059 [Irpex rosettiformis]|uniref:Uncharacterized protein n=1 Tax=Irpex rosettiformis TaxID=378272 RepID=A0ACB8UL04_9APHY|nr:hypothetical protein BDY19DRAFT_916059 [Irpex rosettiformis]